jgi:hypothetical protein
MKRLVKVYLLFLCSLVCSDQIQGQDINTETLKKQKENAVYFASGSSELSSEAIESLNDFLQKKPDLESTEFRLQAFTDDVGSPERNALLAKSRAVQVQEYLNKQDIPINTIAIQAFQQLHLNPEENVVEQRANNRRVVVELWGISLETGEDLTNVDALTIEKFFNQDPKEYQQDFSFNATKGTVIEGEKGTVLQIPANCFVDSEGNVVTGEISFLLQEAYSYSDMLFQNLSTVSGDELLETGGMLFIEAKDTAGNVLNIREGAEITAAMASTAAKESGMQTFEGELDTATNRINWVATNQPLLTDTQNASNARSLRVSSNTNRFYQRSSLNESLDELKEIPTWKVKLPREIEKPKFRLRVPKYPRLYELEQPNRNTLKVEIPQNPNSSNATYNSKIRKKFLKLKSAYLKKRQSNQVKTHTYKRDSIHYEKALVKHGKNTAKYQEYNVSMRLVLEEMQENMTSFDLGAYRREYNDLKNFSEEFRRRNTGMSGGKKYVEDQLNNNSIYDSLAQPLQAKLSAIDLSSFTEEENELLEDCWSKKTGKKLSNYSSRTDYKDYKFRTNNHRIANIYNRATETGNLKPYRLRQIRRMKGIVEELYNYKQLLKVGEEVQDNKQKVLPLITRFLNMETAIIDLEKEFLEVRTELNILEPIEVASIYGNAMSIRRVGWLNCDRFIRRPNMTELEIITGYTENTRVIVVSGGRIKSLVSAIPDQISFKVLQIPKGRVVKIIGIRTLGDNVEVFVEQGTVQSLKGVKPTFKKKTEKEAKAMMLAI